jgi:hypothetical protein
MLSKISTAYLEASGRRSGKLLSHNHIVEVVELLAINSSIHDVPAIQMLAGTQTHSKYAIVRHLVDQLLTDLFNIQVSHISNGSIELHFNLKRCCSRILENASPGRHVEDSSKICSDLAGQK